MVEDDPRKEDPKHPQNISKTQPKHTQKVHQNLPNNTLLILD